MSNELSKSVLAYPELSVVRVNAQESGCRHFTGSEGVIRAPRTGDLGTIVHVYEAGPAEPMYTVESVGSDGYTVWLADFAHSEVLLERTPRTSQGSDPSPVSS
jgi:hypothetical protein